MFVQIIEGRTSDADGLMRQGERWQDEVGRGAVGFLGVTAGVTADGRAITIVRFESEDAARKNSQRAEQTAWWTETAKYYDGEPSFTESSDVQEFLGGGSNDAGFVQVMKSTKADRALMTRMDEMFMKHANERPDVLGSFRVWTGPSSCVEAVYFRSEVEARAGEQKEMPAEAQKLMDEFQTVIANTEFFDLTKPSLR